MPQLAFPQKLLDAELLYALPGEQCPSWDRFYLPPDNINVLRVGRGTLSGADVGQPEDSLTVLCPFGDDQHATYVPVGISVWKI